MRSCAVWHVSSSSAGFATTSQTTAGLLTNLNRQSVLDDEAGYPARPILIHLFTQSSHATVFVHRIRCCFPSPQRRRFSADVSEFNLGWSRRKMPARRSLYARPRTEMARKALSRSRIRQPHVSPHCNSSHVLELMVAAGRKPSPQAVVAFVRFADRRQLRLVSFNCCSEDVLEAVIVNPREVLTQDRGAKFIRR